MAKRDEYEAGFMGGDAAIHREKHVSRWFAAMMGAPAIGALAGAVAVAFLPDAGAPLLALPLVGVSALVVTMGLYFSAMRIVVTPAHVEVQYGTLGPRIPIESIESARIEKLGVIGRYAWGPKLEGMHAWRYVPPGVRLAVRLEYTLDGKQHSCLIGSRDAPTLLEAIEHARARKGGGVRVETAREADDEHEDEDGEEVEAASEEGGKSGQHHRA